MPPEPVPSRSSVRDACGRLINEGDIVVYASSSCRLYRTVVIGFSDSGKVLAQSDPQRGCGNSYHDPDDVAVVDAAPDTHRDEVVALSHALGDLLGRIHRLPAEKVAFLLGPMRDES